MNILIKRVAGEMNSWRNAAKSKYGDKYESRVAPFRSLLEREVKVRKCSCAEAAAGFIKMLELKGKLNNHLKAVIFSAALDLVERKVGDM